MSPFKTALLCFIAIVGLFGPTVFAQESSSCPPPPDPSVKFTAMRTGQTMQLPPRFKYEFAVAPTPDGCAITTLITLPNGSRLWLPAGKVYDSADGTYQNWGGPATYEAEPAGAFNNWQGWFTADDGYGNCNSQHDNCPSGFGVPKGHTGPWEVGPKELEKLNSQN